MLGGKNKQPLGYTIIEVLIVLAISSVMFLIASSFINGKQEKASFTSGINQLSSDIQNVIQQVADGKYSDIPVRCNYVSGTVYIGGSPNSQGTNSQCVFLGKFIALPTSPTSPSTFSILSLAGGRLDATDVNSSANAGDPTIIDTLTVKQGIPENLRVYAESQFDSTGRRLAHTNGFGFIQSQGVAGTNGSFQTGGQTINLVYSPGPTINNNFAYANTVLVCMTDGTQSAELVIGNDNNQLGVRIIRKSDATC